MRESLSHGVAYRQLSFASGHRLDVLCERYAILARSVGLAKACLYIVTPKFETPGTYASREPSWIQDRACPDLGNYPFGMGNALGSAADSVKNCHGVSSPLFPVTVFCFDLSAS
jgi:hypothetical protein